MVLPALAEAQMEGILSLLEKVFLGRDCAIFAECCGSFLILLMALEVMDWHTAKEAFHEQSYQSVEPKEKGYHPIPGAVPLKQKAIQQLIGFYKACWSGCHERRLKDGHLGNRSGELLGEQSIALLSELKTWLSDHNENLLVKMQRQFNLLLEDRFGYRIAQWIFSV